MPLLTLQAWLGMYATLKAAGILLKTKSRANLGINGTP